MMRLRRTLLAVGAAALLAAAPASAAPASGGPQAQDPPKQEESKPKPKAKKKKVWTNEDVKGLRKPWDEYQSRKAEQAEEGQPSPAEAPAAEPAAPQQEGDLVLPATAEATADLHSQYVESIGVQTEMIRTARMEYYDEADPDKREELRQRVEQLEAELEEFVKIEQRLREHLEKLRAQQPQGAAQQVPAAPPAPPPPPRP